MAKLVVGLLVLSILMMGCLAKGPLGLAITPRLEGLSIGLHTDDKQYKGGSGNRRIFGAHRNRTAFHLFPGRRRGPDTAKRQGRLIFSSA